MNKVYTVHAYRWGDRERHSYLVGVWLKKHAALKASEYEEDSRGGKYVCEVIEWEPKSKYQKSDDGMPYRIVKALPKISVLEQYNRKKGRLDHRKLR